MSQILRIDSSLFGEHGQSYPLTEVLSQKLASQHQATIVHRDLIKSAIPHFDANTIADIAKGEAALADELIAEVQASDYVVIAAPMYNFTIPSQLKSWFDHIARAQVTFHYTENGPEGLLVGKKVYVIVTSGGQHANSPSDGISPYLTTMLGFLGLAENLEFIYAEGLAMGDDNKTNSINAALAEIDTIA